MPIRGEAIRKTYSGHKPIAKGIWVARHEILGENCVQKTYEPAGREDAIAFAEPRLLNELDHPHITPLRDAQFDPERPGCVTMVMRVYEGGSIYNALGAGHRFSVGTAISLLADVADALSYLHVSKRYLHRDIKPKNVLLDRQRRAAFLADFGSAAMLDGTTGTAAAARTTPLYQSPEAGRTGQVGPPADMYALGLTAFELVNGLFDYASLDPAKIDSRINKGQRSLPERYIEPAAFEPHVPERLRTAIRQLLAADPARRPTAPELLRLLRNLRCIDWQKDTGASEEWSGHWPPARRRDRQIELSVRALPLRGGPQRGRLRLDARYRSASSGGWRTVGVPDETVDDHDAAALSAFFKAVDAQVARRWPA